MSSIYKGAAALGRPVSSVSMAVGMIAGGLFIVLGIILLLRKPAQVAGAIATVDKAVCIPSGNGLVSCTLNLTYQIGSQQYHTLVQTVSPQLYIDGQTVQITYDPNNPQIVHLGNIVPPNPTVLGGILLPLGLLIIGGSWAINRIVQKNDFAAATMGTGFALETLSRAF